MSRHAIFMNPKQIDRFFEVFSRELGEEGQILLTGAGAGALYGRIRPSFDVDFELTLRKKNPALWENVERAAATASQATGIQANFADNIDRWGMISLLDYRKHRVVYKHIGLLKLELMDPLYWSIGKMTRFLTADVDDIVEVFKRQKVPWKKAVQIWARALKQSPRSTALYLFKQQVEYFLRVHARKCWGNSFSAEEAIAIFHRMSGVKTPK